MTVKELVIELLGINHYYADKEEIKIAFEKFVDDNADLCRYLDKDIHLKFLGNSFGFEIFTDYSTDVVINAVKSD
jgi:hypothetical protein